MGHVWLTLEQFGIAWGSLWDTCASLWNGLGSLRGHFGTLLVHFGATFGYLRVALVPLSLIFRKY